MWLHWRALASKLVGFMDNETTPQSKLPTKDRNENETRLSENDAKQVVAFLEQVRSIIARLLADGYRLDDGKLIPPDTSATVRSNK